MSDTPLWADKPKHTGEASNSFIKNYNGLTVFGTLKKRMFMQSKDNNFESLIGHVRSMLGCSYEGLKRKYLNFPISFIVHLENKILEKVIEIRFSEQEATVTLGFEQMDKCNVAYIFFDSQSYEDNFIEYLAEFYDFDFRKNNWLLDSCYLKVTNLKDIFCFCLFQE